MRGLALKIRSSIVRLLKAIKGAMRNLTATKVVTLDIDSAAIRLMEMRGGRVARWASIPFEPVKGEGESVSGLSNLGAAVKELMTSSGIKAKKVIASVSGLYSVSRILSVSNPPEGVTLAGAVLEMADETMPLAGDRLYISWQPVLVAEGERQVLVLGVPREIVDDEVRSLKSVGINPRILELKAMALTRAANKKQAIILNIEPSSFDIVVIVGGVPEIMRPIAWQPDDFTLEDKVEHLAVTLEMTVDFFNSRHPDTPLDPATPLFVTGQVFEDIALMEKLEARLRYPVETLMPPVEYPVHLPIAQYAVNIGLALRGTAPSKNLGRRDSLPLDINLLPGIYHPWRPSAKQLYTLAAIIVVIALLFPLFRVTTEATAETTKLETRFNIFNNELQRRKLEIQNREPLQKAIAEYHSIIDIRSHFAEDLLVINGEAEKLGVQVESITHDGKMITIIGKAEDFITFRKYLTALEKSGRFATPVPPPEGYPFTKGGTIKLEPVKPETGK